MRLAPSGQGERFAVENQGVGVVPIEFLGDGDHTSLSEAYHILRRLDLPSGPPIQDRLSAAFDVWREALTAAGIELRLERRALYGDPLPPTTRAPDSRGISLRPWDIELTAIEAGLRKVVKLDRVPPEYVGALRDDAVQRGLLVETVTPRDVAAAGVVTVLVSYDVSTLADARDLEERLLVRGSVQHADGASAKMGELLGYPSCCVQRFARVAEHNDTNLAWALLPGAAEPASPFTQWLQPGLALLSHSPCDLGCVPSTALGGRLLEAVEATETGFAARWRTLTARIQVVDQRGNRLALAADGPLDDSPRIAAADLLGSGGTDPEAEERAASLVGRRIQLDCGGLVVADCDWYAPYVADHRGR